ncbi:FAD-dependent monooxygenase [cf. Phormidesmis sp. LEGE 11477]|nr:NAD(P)/FAD-dependent oxidoreductase [cf. Phormidesmis sp. LEGE 11477]MBE9063932.1 FAD-dependent monooxygenase [cf. Phormidesmis sp. LEGE 11477]
MKATIVGAGPAGLLLAHYLLARDYRVEIYDRRPDPRTIDLDQRRSFPISLQERGRSALKGIPGLEDAIASHSVFCKGTVMHSKKGDRDIPRKNEVMTVDRNQLVLTLLEQLTAKYAQPELTIRFDCVCDRIDDQQQTVGFQTAEGEDFSVRYDRLIGADGARSQVRDQLSTRYGLSSELNYVPDAYKSIFLARKKPEQGVEFAPDRIHATNLGKDCRIILAPLPGDVLHGAFIFAGPNPLATFTTKEEVLDYFETNIPTFRSVLSTEEAEALLQRPTARLLTVKCEQFHYGDRILLIGDAAHAVSPSIGQGCNSALQDIAIINRLLDRYQDDWAQAIAQFSKERVTDAHALIALSDYSFPRSKRLIPEFLLRLKLGRKLNRWFPQWFKPFVFDLVLDSDMSYSEILELSQGWINKVKRSNERLNQRLAFSNEGATD